MEKNPIFKQWNIYQKERSSEVQLSSDSYASETAKQQVLSALLFWKFIRQELFNYDSDAIKDFLMSFFIHENQYISLVAKIEMLPTRVWRKCLWRYNMDFLSFESFLRRITSEQIQFITDNITDVFNGKKARVLKIRLIDRIVDFFRNTKIQHDNLERSDLNEDRYKTKGAWTKNLASLSFGFALYKNGTENDEQAQKANAQNFFDTKSHINDFIVNQEDGVYWFFYRFVRSFGGFRDWDYVRLSPWICPGFWKTLALMVWFLTGPVIGGFLFISGGMEFLSVTGISSIVLVLPFVLWSVCMTIILLFIVIVTLVTFIGNLFADVDGEKIKDGFLQVLIPIGNILIFGVAAGILYLISLGFIKLYAWLTVVYGVMLPYPEIYSITCTVIVLYAFGLLMQLAYYGLQDRDVGDYAENMVENHWFLKTLLVVAIIVGFTSIGYFRFEIWDFFVLIFGYIMDFFGYVVDFVMYLIDNGVTVILVTSFLHFSYYLFKVAFIVEDYAFLKARKKVIWSSIAFGTILVFSFVYHADFFSTVVLDNQSEIIFLAFVIPAVFVLCMFIMNIHKIFSLEKESVEKKVIISAVIRQEISFDKKKKFSFYHRLYSAQINKNEFLTKDNISDTFKSLWDLGRVFFPNHYSYRLKFMSFALASVDSELISKITSMSNDKDFMILTKWRRYKFMEFFLQNKDEKKSVDMLIELVKEEDKKEDEQSEKAKRENQKRLIWEQRMKKVGKVLRIIAYPFILLWKFILLIGRFLVRCKEVAQELYQFWITTTKKSCPKVADEKNLV